MIAPIDKLLKLQTHGVSRFEKMATDMVRALHIHHYQKSHGRSVGRPRVGSRDGVLVTLDEYCISQGGITDETFRSHYECAEAVIFRLGCSTDTDKKDLYWLMQIAPAELNHAQRQSMVARIAKLGLVEGDTMTYLRKEYRAARGKAVKVLPSEGTAAEASLPAEPANEIDQVIVSRKLARDAELQKLFRVRDVIAAEHERRVKKSLEKLLGKTSVADNSALANLAFDAWKDSQGVR
jgi:hypothetical protein